MALDLPTLLLVAVVLSIVAAVACLTTWFQHRDEAALLWMAGVPILGILGALARALLPILPAIVIGNVAVLLAGSAFWAACRALRRLDVGPMPFLVPPAVWVVACGVPAFQADLNARVALISLMSGAQLACGLGELWADGHARLPAQRALAGVAGVHAALLLVRAVAATVAWNDQTASAGSFALVTLGSLVFVLLLSLTMVVLVKDRASRAHRVDAETDHLTSLANRRQFERDVATAVRRARARGEPLALLMIDVDAFKAFNDLYGHTVGDVCLREVARAFHAALGERKASAYRYGGEEFVVLLPDADAKESLRVADALRCAVTGLKIGHAGSGSGVVTISLGCASAVPKADDAGSSLLEAADRALYRAKEGGRDRVCSGEVEQGRAAAGWTGAPDRPLETGP